MAFPPYLLATRGSCNRGDEPMNRTLMLLSSLATYLAFAGSPLEAASDPRATQLNYKPWIKYCFGASKCFVAAEAKGGCFPSGGYVMIATEDQKASLSVYLGTTRPLEGYISVQIDQGAPISIPHPECRALDCGGKFEIDSDFVERLKRSQTITIDATDSANQKIRLSFSLADFAKTYDGPEAPLPKVFEETQAKLKEELAKRAEEQKTLQCQE
jgi:invasion protein IalB